MILKQIITKTMGYGFSHLSHGNTQKNSVDAYIAYLIYHGFEAKYNECKNLIYISGYGYYNTCYSINNGIYRLAIQWNCHNIVNDSV